MSPRIVTVPLGEKAYEIAIGPGMLVEAGKRIRDVTDATRLVVVTDENVERHYYKALEKSLKTSGFSVEKLVVEPGEGSKSFAVFEQAMEALLALRPDRKTIIVALGGGVVGDLAGFMASVCLRGIPFVQIPTTLLAQVDSAVGGKTGINSRMGKNLIGSFHQPLLVLADTETLITLPEREMSAGYAEILKYSAIADSDFFCWLIAWREGDGRPPMTADHESLSFVIARSCEEKAAIVAADERESGQRALLNFGHTFAHALEAELGYDGRLLHGEAVSIGMAMAAKLSAKLGHCTQKDAEMLYQHLKACGLPVTLPEAFKNTLPQTLLSHMRGDKKAAGSRIVFVLLKRLGEAFIAKDVPEEAVLEILEQFSRR